MWKATNASHIRNSLGGGEITFDAKPEPRISSYEWMRKPGHVTTS